MAHSRNVDGCGGGCVVFSSLAESVTPRTACGAWTGFGAASIAVIVIVFFHEPATLVRVACIGMILAGVVGLKIFR